MSKGYFDRMTGDNALGIVNCCLYSQRVSQIALHRHLGKGGSVRMSLSDWIIRSDCLLFFHERHFRTRQAGPKFIAFFSVFGPKNSDVVEVFKEALQ